MFNIIANKLKNILKYPIILSPFFQNDRFVLAALQDIVKMFGEVNLPQKTVLLIIYIFFMTIILMRFCGLGPDLSHYNSLIYLYIFYKELYH